MERSSRRYLSLRRQGVDHAVVFTVMKIWLEILGDFGAKTGRFTRENMAKFGPLKIHIVLC